MNTRKEKEKQLREQYIVDIAEKLFLEKGIDDTTMNDIAKNCQLSKTTVYTLFKSKDELEILVYQKIHKVKMKYLISEMKKKDNAYDKLLAFGYAYRSFFSENTSRLQFQLRQDYLGIDKGKIRNEILDNLNKFLDSDTVYMNSIFNQGVDEGVFRKDFHPEEMFELFYLVLRATLNQTLLIDNEISESSIYSKPVDKFEMILNIFLDGIKIKSKDEKQE